MQVGSVSGGIGANGKKRGERSLLQNRRISNHSRNGLINYFSSYRNYFFKHIITIDFIPILNKKYELIYFSIINFSHPDT